ncbi:cellobiose dehydrogenase [Pseudozyma hubeiensis SY62]|uniref:Cellobiose dehydrogenase n=1 Tax=Pseudozyma hubeiensis (strain SY62) TaxID=1305764 RepID=R9NXE5_PSEHS|nr:cellobiose dehydrogenase [Pseudozyma hubeiensis SY62]GAC93333.1 cellobiose dehydrogenase [Pseudozyma hubeiensis SY62]
MNAPSKLSLDFVAALPTVPPSHSSTDCSYGTAPYTSAHRYLHFRSDRIPYTEGIRCLKATDKGLQGHNSGTAASHDLDRASSPRRFCRSVSC